MSRFRKIRTESQPLAMFSWSNASSFGRVRMPSIPVNSAPVLMAHVLLIFSTLGLIGCLDTTKNQVSDCAAIGGVQPTLSPNNANAGTNGVTITVSSTQAFTKTATVLWNDTANGITTSAVDANTLHVQIPARFLTTAGTAGVKVAQACYSSQLDSFSTPATFTIAGPVISSLSPGNTSVGGPAFQLTVFGPAPLEPLAAFVPASVVDWNGSPRTTTYVSSGELVADITAADIASIGTAALTVVNPCRVRRNVGAGGLYHQFRY